MKKILFFTASLLAVSLQTLRAQEKPLQISLSSIRTDLRQSAIKVGIQYAQSIDDIWGQEQSKDSTKIKDNTKSLWTYTPEFKIEMGNTDAFSAISGKISGLYIFFDTTRVGSELVADMSKPLHVFPFSGGFETSNAFQTANGIAEIGYVPWYQLQSIRLPTVLKYSKLGFFLQGGYKFDLHNTQFPVVSGGKTDQSKESMDQPIFRLKGSFSVDTKGQLLNKKGRGIALSGNADGWYDLLNNAVYYRITGKLRAILTPDYFFDFNYEKGSGAPNFNQGEQFGIGLTVSF